MRRSLIVAVLVATPVVAGAAQTTTASSPRAHPAALPTCRLIGERDIATVLGHRIAASTEIPAGAGQLCTYFADSANQRPLLEVAVTDFGSVARAEAIFRQHERQFLKDKPLDATRDSVAGRPAIAYRAKGDRDRAGRVIHDATRVVVIHVMWGAEANADSARASSLARLALRGAA
jgi:hypothetical protein